MYKSKNAQFNLTHKLNEYLFSLPKGLKGSIDCDKKKKIFWVFFQLFLRNILVPDYLTRKKEGML